MAFLNSGTLPTEAPCTSNTPPQLPRRSKPDFSYQSVHVAHSAGGKTPESHSYNRKDFLAACCEGSEVRCMLVAWKNTSRKATTRRFSCITSYAPSSTEGKYSPTVLPERSRRSVLEYKSDTTSTSSKLALMETTCTFSYKAPPQHLRETLFRPSRASRHELFSNKTQRSSGCCGVVSSGRKVTMSTPSDSTQRPTRYETMSKTKGSPTQNYTKASRPCLMLKYDDIPRQLAAR